MAMVLQPSRVRLTQAIYFGRPAGFGVTSITGGNGITATPNPIITTGTLDLGPLTSDWQAGNFNINARNTTGWFNVVAYGADPAGLVNCTAFVANAITDCQVGGGGIVYFPPGTYLITPGVLVISQNGVALYGDKAIGVTISAAAGAAGAVFRFSAGVNPIHECAIANMKFRSTDLVTQKTMVEISDAREFIASGIRSNDGEWTGASSVGVDIKGREMIRVRDCRIAADIPIQIGPDPNLALGGLDLSSIEDSNLVVNVVNQPAIKVLDNTVLTSIYIKNVDGNAGAGFLNINSTGPALISRDLVIVGCRTEQTNDPTAYSIDIRNTAAALQGLIIDGFGCDAGGNGLRLGNVQRATVTELIYENGAGTALNLAADTRAFTLIDSIIVAGATITDASVTPVVVNSYVGTAFAYSAFGTLSATQTLSVKGFTMLGTSMVPTVGATTEIIRNSTYTTEAGALYIRTGNGAGEQGLVFHTDKANAVASLQSIQPSTSPRPLLLNPLTGNVGIHASTATRALDLNGVQRYRGQAAPAVSEANSGTIYFDSATNKFKASLNGSAYVDIIGSGGLTGSGTTGQVAYWDGTTSLGSPSAIYIDAINNRIGINVPAPTYPFDIDGDINVINAPATIRLAGDPVMQAGTGATKLGGTHGTITASDTAIGSGAMANASGAGAGGNTAIGLQAMGLSTAAENNTAVGALALDATQGVANVAVGVAAGLTNTTGSYNIFIGETADATAGNLTNAAAIGRGATIADSNALNIGGGIQKVGLGVSTPKHMLDVNGAVAMRQAEVTLVNGLNSDIVSITESSWLRFVGPTGAFSIGGFGSAFSVTDGQILAVYNTVAQQMTIVNEDLSSTAIFRIKTLTGGDVVLRAGTSAATFRYDATDDRWILMSSN